MLVWFAVLLIAVAAFAAAVVWAGGPSTVEQLLGGIKLPVFFGAPSPAPAGNGGVSASALASSTLPAAAQQRMYAEQLDSAAAINDLVGGRFASFTLGAAQESSASATVPVTAAYTDGRSVKGVLHLQKDKDLWYFFSITTGAVPESADVELVRPASFDSGVVSAITQQQALPGTQDMITSGLLGGGYKHIKVGAITHGPRTATVDVTLDGGSEQASNGRFVLISKTDGATTYWFVARFEKR